MLIRPRQWMTLTNTCHNLTLFIVPTLKSSTPLPGDPPAYLSQDVEFGRTFYHGRSARSAGVAIICGGREHCAANFLIERKDFPYLCMEWVASGKGHLILDGKNHPLSPGSIFFYGPQVSHRITTDPSERMVKYFVNFEGSGVVALLRKYRLKIPSFRQLPPGSRLMEFFDLLIETGARATAAQDRLECLLLESLLVLAAEENEPSDSHQGKAYQTYLECRTYLENNLRKLRSMDGIATACHIDPAYLTRLFRRFAGETPHRVLTHLKMNAAALQLVRRQALVKEVAEEFGYADPYHFSKVFKKIHGLSPETYARGRR